MQSSNPQSTAVLVVATACLAWYIIVVLVSITGYIQIWRYYSKLPEPGSQHEVQHIPDVTIIRPVKGLEPSMYECLASTFRQEYLKSKLHIRLCVAQRNDPAVPVLKRLISDFPEVDTEILIEDEDEDLQLGRLTLGPNPKIRNMSRAYREAPGDIIWIIDCNVWVPKYTLGRMVSLLRKGPSGNPTKFVHQMPIVVDTVGTTVQEEINGTTNELSEQVLDGTRLRDDRRTLWNIGGGRLEELFMASMHPKYYVAINTVSVAPCTIGKSTMLRRSHLNAITDGRGIDYFSENICEDQLLGDLLWKKRVPEEIGGAQLNKHALCLGSLAVQPMSNMSIGEYWNRRVRWLRVRKYTVTLATFVEPGTEAFICALYGAFAATTLPFFRIVLGIPPTWTAFSLAWLLTTTLWCAADLWLYRKLHSACTIHVDADTPGFAKSYSQESRRSFGAWLLAWIGRETLALPIWVCGFWLGATVEWRGQKFWVGMDMKVHAINDDAKTKGMNGNGHASPRRIRAE